MNWFLYDNGLRHEIVNQVHLTLFRWDYLGLLKDWQKRTLDLKTRYIYQTIMKLDTLIPSLRKIC